MFIIIRLLEYHRENEIFDICGIDNCDLVIKMVQIKRCNLCVDRDKVFVGFYYLIRDRY